MKRKFNPGCILLSLCVATIVSCSSNDKKDEGASPDVAEATSDSGAPADPNAAPADPNAPADANAAPADPNAAPADPNAPPPADGAAAAAPPADGADMAANPTNTADANALDSGAAPTDPNAAPADPNAAPSADTAAAAPPPAADPGAPADAGATPPTDTASAAPTGGDQNQTDLFGAASADTGATPTGDTPPPAHRAALAHIKDAPFSKGGQNLNTVYIARDGDTLQSISQKLFGEDKTKQLKKGNPTLKKGVKTGDKVYFNSPTRPDDKEKMLTVYEDQGLPPSTYTTKDGDTLKSLAQEWYGSEDSYKEVYALNRNLASTKELPAGTELQYWPATAQVAVYGAKKEPEVAQAPPPPGPGAPGDMNQNNMMAPPPPPGGAPPNNNAMMPPPPPPGGMDNGNMPGAAAGMANNGMNNGMPPQPGAGAGALPPPPGPDQMAPPPPMASSKHKTKDLTSSSMAGMDKDTIMYAAAAGVLLIGSGLLIAIRRRNSRKNSGITQV